MTQPFSGHGPFRSYPHKMDKADIADCMYLPESPILQNIPAVGHFVGWTPAGWPNG